MRHRIFVDTGAWIAISIERDQYHKEAALYWKTLSKDRAMFYTSNLIVHETYTFLSRNETKKIALQVIDAMHNDSSVSILHVNDEMETKAFDLLRKWNDQDFGSIDATSFCLMQANSIKKAFSFDSHFRIHGFDLVPIVNR